MTCLTDPSEADVLDRLLAEAPRRHEALLQQRQELVARGPRSGSPEFADTTRRAHVAVAPGTGELLYPLTGTERPQARVEFGASPGVWRLYLAAALQDNGSGWLITTGIKPTKITTAAPNVAEASLADQVELMEADALLTHPRQDSLSGNLLFIDGSSRHFLDVLHLFEPDIGHDALIVVDNADSPGYRDVINDNPDFVSVADNGRLEVSLWRGDGW